MHYQLDYINKSIDSSAEEFAIECDRKFAEKVSEAADLVCENMNKSPIVFLSGPSASGKTTTALKIEEELKSRGIGCNAISLDKYFQDIDPERSPRTPNGDYDYESPDCLDIELLNEHFDLLSKHQTIRVPHFDFTTKKRSEKKYRDVCLGKNDIAVFEGIHALNDIITERHTSAFKLYVSARSSVYSNDTQVFKSKWIRMMRRIVRDNKFRGSDAQFTLGLWENIRRGEKLYIYPFEDKADYKFDSTIPYEIGVLKQYSLPLLMDVPNKSSHYDDINEIIESFSLFNEIDSSVISPSSLIREFVGGGIYKY